MDEAIDAGPGPHTRRNLRTLGWSDQHINRLLRNGTWRSHHRGVLVGAGTSLDRHAAHRAAISAVSPQAVIGRESAIEHWEFEGLPTPAEGAERPIQLWVPPAVNAESRQGIDVRHTSLAPEEIVEHLGVRVTTPARSVVDIARVYRRDVAVAVADSGLRDKAFTRAELEVAVARLARARGVVAARKVSRLARPKTRSCGETRIRLRIVEAGFPEPEVGFELIHEQGWLLAEADLAYALLLIWIEYDGFAVHTEKETFRRDRSRERFLERRGWFVLRTTGSDVANPAGFLADLRAAVADAPRRIAALPAARSPEVAAARRALGLR